MEALMIILTLLTKPEVNPHIYAKTTEVVEISYEEDTVVVEDHSGNLWCFYGVEDWMVGDTCLVTFYNNTTLDITDDVIISCTYEN